MQCRHPHSSEPHRPSARYPHILLKQHYSFPQSCTYTTAIGHNVGAKAAAAAVVVQLNCSCCYYWTVINYFRLILYFSCLPGYLYVENTLIMSFLWCKTLFLFSTCMYTWVSLRVAYGSQWLVLSHLKVWYFLCCSASLLLLSFCLSELSGRLGCISCTVWLDAGGSKLWERHITDIQVSPQFRLRIWNLIYEWIELVEPEVEDNYSFVLKYGPQSTDTAHYDPQCATNSWTPRVHDSGWVLTLDASFCYVPKLVLCWQ